MRRLEDLLDLQLTAIDGEPLRSTSVDQPALRRGVHSITAEWIAAELPFGQNGISTFADGRLLLTTGAGLLIADPETGATLRLLQGAGVTDAKALSSGDIAVVRRHGVAVISPAGVKARGGPYGGRVRFADGVQDDLVIFSNDADGHGRPQAQGCGATLVTLGEGVGDDTVQELDYPTFGGAGAMLLGDERILVLGNPPVLFHPDGTRRELQLNLSNPFAGVPALQAGHVLVSGGDVDLVLLDPTTGRTAWLGQFNLHGSVTELAMVPGSRTAGYLYAHHQIGNESFGAVVRFDLGEVTLDGRECPNALAASPGDMASPESTTPAS